MRLIWPVRFTHVYLLIWQWLCEDRGGGGGFSGVTNRHIAKCVAEAWSRMSVFRVGDSVIPCHLFLRRRSSSARLNAQAWGSKEQPTLPLYWHCSIFILAWQYVFGSVYTQIYFKKKLSYTQTPHLSIVCLFFMSVACSQKKPWHNHNLLHISERWSYRTQ